MSDYKPSPSAWVAEQVEQYERSGGTEALTLRDTGLPVIIVTNQGWKTGAIRRPHWGQVGFSGPCTQAGHPPSLSPGVAVATSPAGHAFIGPVWSSPTR